MKRIITLLACVPISATAADLLADGELCLGSLQCASGICSRSNDISLSKCAAPAAVGESCGTEILSGIYYDITKPCASGLVCQNSHCAEMHTCPSGYIAIDSPYITIATSCPSGTTAIGTAESCLVSSPSGSCIMYAPVGMSFTDDSGTYEYTEPCAME